MSETDFGMRQGEVAVELPSQFDASLYFIGRIRTPWTDRGNCPKNARESHEVCTIEIADRWKAALKGVESCTHLVVLYWMDRSRRDLVVQVPRHYGVGRGTFALRSPARPNPIAMSVVRLLRVEGAKRGSANPAHNPHSCRLCALVLAANPRLLCMPEARAEGEALTPSPGGLH
jgi:tRNA-Thr(GGU) m(6)t(6)A37 methyltransferase TsaA